MIVAEKRAWDWDNIPVFAGLKDDGHVMLRCSNCNAALVDCWVTRKVDAIEWKIRAKCDHCGDYSFATKIKGNFHIGPGVEPNPENPNDEEDKIVYSTVVGDITEDDMITILTKKEKEYDHRKSNR